MLTERSRHEDLGLSHPWGLAVDEQRGIVYVTEIGKDTLVAYHEETRQNGDRIDRIDARRGC